MMSDQLPFDLFREFVEPRENINKQTDLVIDCPPMQCRQLYRFLELIKRKAEQKNQNSSLNILHPQDKTQEYFSVESDNLITSKKKGEYNSLYANQTSENEEDLQSQKNESFIEKQEQIKNNIFCQKYTFTNQSLLKSKSLQTSNAIQSFMDKFAQDQDTQIQIISQFCSQIFELCTDFKKSCFLLFPQLQEIERIAKLYYLKIIKQKMEGIKEFCQSQIPAVKFIFFYCPVINEKFIENFSCTAQFCYMVQEQNKIGISYNFLSLLYLPKGQIYFKEKDKLFSFLQPIPRQLKNKRKELLWNTIRQISDSKDIRSLLEMCAYSLIHPVIKNNQQKPYYESKIEGDIINKINIPEMLKLYEKQFFALIKRGKTAFSSSNMDIEKP